MNWLKLATAIALGSTLVIGNHCSAALPSASRESPTSSTLTIITGSSQTFVVRGTDTDANLRGAEWYLNGTHQVSHFTMSGSSATDSWAYTFNLAGTYIVEALVFDAAGGYSSAARWTVTVQNNVAPVASRSSPSGSSVSLLPGSSQTFVVRGTDSNGNLRGAEWYLDGAPQVSHFTMSGSSDTDSWFRTFNSAGTFTVEALVFDTLNLFSSAARWTVTVQPDTTPPTPNPMTFSTAPYGYSTTSIRMVTTQANDDWYSVEYYFYCALNGGGGGDYGFTANREYIDTGLSVNVRYGYQVLARDTSPNLNQGNYSTTRYAYTLANTPSAPAVGDATGSSLNVDVQANGNPSSTEFAIYNDTSGYYVNATGGNNGSTAVWRADSQWGTVTVTGLSPNTPYSFKVKARNGDSVETVFGPTASGTTLNVNFPPTLTRSSPNQQTLTVSVGSSLRFQAAGADTNGNLSGAEWYGPGCNACVQYVSDVGGNGNAATFSKIWTFNSPGTNQITINAFDTLSSYAPAITWNVVVKDKTRGMYVDGEFSGDTRFFTDSAAQDALLQLAKNYGIQYLCIYYGNIPWGSQADIQNFLQKARTSYYGIKQVGVACGSLTSWYDQIIQFNAGHSEKFDALNLEGEAMPISVILTTLDYMNSVRTPGMVVEAYLSAATMGSMTGQEARTTAGKADRLLLPCYVADPATAYSRLQSPMSLLASENAPEEVWPIFSAENHAPENYFMGQWLKTHAMAEAESIWLNSFSQDNPAWRYGVIIGGFQYFSYRNLLNDVDHPPTAARNAPSAANVTVPPGTVVNFVTDATDVDANLRGSEWYMNAAHQASHFDLSGAADTDTWSYTFTTEGVYQIAVRVFDANTTPLYSAEASWTVTVQSPPSAPTANVPTGITSSGFTANWSTASGATGYRLDVSTTSSFGSYVSGYQDLDVGNVTSKAVTGLNAGTTYYYRVRANNTGGTSGNSGIITVVTVPAAPSANGATGITSDAFTANWSSATGATGYRLDVSTNSGFADFVSGYQNLDVGNVVSKNVTGLGAGKTYYYRLRAYNGSGTSANSGTITVTTEQSPYPTLRFTSIARPADGSTVLNLEGSAGWTYLIQASTNMTSWKSFHQATAVANSFPLIATNTTNSWQFYRAIGFPLTNSVPHPADLNADFSISTNEHTAYLNAFTLGAPWPIPPSPVDADYYGKAYQIFKLGQVYHVDTRSNPPQCWVPGL